jgi:hypothetical protein
MSNLSKQTFKNLHLEDLNVKDVLPLISNGKVNVNGMNFYDITNGDVSLPSGTAFIKVDDNGISTLTIDKIQTHTESELIVGGLVITGNEQIHFDVNQETMYCLNIEEYMANTQINLKSKVVIGDTPYQELHLFNASDINTMTIGKKTTSTLQIFNTDSMIFDSSGTSSYSFRLGGVDRKWDGSTFGTERFKIDNSFVYVKGTLKTNKVIPDTTSYLYMMDVKITDDDIEASKLSVDNIVPLNGTDLTFGANDLVTISDSGVLTTPTLTATTINTSSIVGGPFTLDGVTISGGTLTCTTLNAPTINTTIIEPSTGSGVTIDDVNLKNNVVTSLTTISTNISTSLITKKTSSGVYLETVLFKDGNITTSGDITGNAIHAASLTTGLIFDPVVNNGVNIDGVLCKDGSIYADSIFVDHLEYQYQTIATDILNSTSGNGIVVGDFLDVSSYYIKCNNFPTFDWKDSCCVRSSSNITLENLQTIDGFVLSVGCSVLVTGQTDKTENGVYDVVDGGPWTRRVDSNTTEDLQRAIVPVVEGDTNQGIYYQTKANPVIGVDDIEYVDFVSGSVLINHNDLAGLNVDDHLHLTAAEYSDFEDYSAWVLAGSSLSSDGSINLIKDIVSTTNDLNIKVPDTKVVNIMVDGNIVGQFYKI